jgi:serine/threonine protein kinase
MIGRFEIRAELGIGGFGIVYKAYDPLTHREVAIKIPRLEVLTSEPMLRRFELEAAAAGQHLKHSPSKWTRKPERVSRALSAIRANRKGQESDTM